MSGLLVMPRPNVGSVGAAGNDIYTKALLHFDGADSATTITDVNKGGSPHTWTANGNAALDTGIAPKFGSASLICDGTGDYVATPDHADFELGTGDWTVDLWFNRQGGNGTRRFMCGQGAGGSGTTAVAIELSAANVVNAAVGNGSAVTAVTGTTSFTATGWNHVALVRTGNTLKLFVNGTQEGGDVAFASTVLNSSTDWCVGRQGSLTTLTWNGLIDAFRLSVGIARWTSNFTPPSRAYR